MRCDGLGALAVALVAVACSEAPPAAGPAPTDTTPALVASVEIPPNYGIHDTYVRDGIAFVSAWNSWNAHLRRRQRDSERVTCRPRARVERPGDRWPGAQLLVVPQSRGARKSLPLCHPGGTGYGRPDPHRATSMSWTCSISRSHTRSPSFTWMAPAPTTCGWTRAPRCSTSPTTTPELCRSTSREPSRRPERARDRHPCAGRPREHLRLGSAALQRLALRDRHAQRSLAAFGGRRPHGRAGRGNKRSRPLMARISGSRWVRLHRDLGFRAAQQQPR